MLIRYKIFLYNGLLLFDAVNETFKLCLRYNNNGSGINLTLKKDSARVAIQKSCIGIFFGNGKAKDNNSFLKDMQHPI